MVRLNTDGSLDTSFGGDGSVNISLSGDTDFAQSVAIQADGQIVVAGRFLALPPTIRAKSVSCV